MIVKYYNHFGAMRKKTSMDYHRRLTSLRQIHYDSEQQFNLPSQQIQTIDNYQGKALQLRRIITKVKSKILAKEFLKKMKRNLIQSDDFQLNKQFQCIYSHNKPICYLQGLIIDETFKAYFMAVDTVAILLIQVLSSFQALFEEYRQIFVQSAWLYAIKCLILLVFWLKVIQGLISVRIYRGVFILNIITLSYLYVTSWTFFFDFGIFVTTILTLALPNSQLIGGISFLMCVISIPVFLKNIQIIQNRFINNKKKKLYWSLIKIILFDIFFAHLISTLLYAISLMDENDNWRVLVQIDNQEWYVQYLMAYYWGTTIITTVGFGDILPSNYIQAIIITFIMLFGTLVLSYNISQVGEVVGSLRAMDYQHQNDLGIFKRMAKDDKISIKLQEQIINYIDQVSKMKNEQQFQQRRQLLNKLPQQMRMMYQYEVSDKTFTNLPFFKLIKKQTLMGFSQILNGKIYYPGSYITEKNKGLPDITIIMQGNLTYNYHKHNSTLNGVVVQTRQILKNTKPYLLNKYLLTPEKQINYTIEAKTYCFTNRINMLDFHKVLSNFPHDNQFYFSLLHKNFLIETEWEGVQCKYCPGQRHTLFDCYKIHYVPYRNLIISKHISLYGQNQPRKTQDKRRFKLSISKKHTLSLYKKLYKNYEQAWQIHNKKALTQRILNDQGGKKAEEDELTEVRQMMNHKHYYLYRQLYSLEEEMQVDVLYNFNWYFSSFNPSQLTYFNLKKEYSKKQQIKKVFSSYKL